LENRQVVDQLPGRRGAAIALSSTLVLLALARSGQASEQPAAKPAVPRAAANQNLWEPVIRAFEAKDRKQPPAKGQIVFVGGSSIVMWDLTKSFPGAGAINRGFGGSQLADSVRYADRIVIPYEPRIVVLYAGDNDLAAGKTPNQVAADYRKFVAKLHAALPKTQILYVAIKPSRARWGLIDKIREANRLIQAASAKDPRLVFIDVEKPLLGPDGMPRRELFLPDGLHLNSEGYRLWSDLVRPHLKDSAPE
jgi:lysophospholipase L1-like esterase